jgi:DNA-binding PadR family transcriptional regulator
MSEKDFDCCPPEFDERNSDDPHSCCDGHPHFSSDHRPPPPEHDSCCGSHSRFSPHHHPPPFHHFHGGYPPSDGEGPRFPFPPFDFRGSMGPRMMMSKDFFRELRYFFVLSILSEIPDGITGYRLQETYQFPRGNIVRLLEELATQNYLTTEDTTIDGRAQKIFKISETGKKYLSDLKRKWAEFFTNMSDHCCEPGGPCYPEEPQMEFLRKLEEFDNKDDALDLVRGIRSGIKRQWERIDQRVQRVQKIKNRLDALISFIEKMDPYDPKAVKQFLDQQGQEK